LEKLVNKAAERCEEYRLAGYHCSEATIRAVSEVLGLELNNDVLKTACGFRGGGGMRERCGVVEAGIIIIGLKYGRLKPTEKSGPYRYLVGKLHQRFLEELGSYTCRDLFIPSKRLDGNCSFIYQNGAKIVTRLLLEADRLIAEMPPEEAEKY
jgi:C_GCAxxG_C_C family probable redox protein